LTPKEKKLGFLGSFPDPEVADLTQSEQQKNDPATRLRSKNFDLDPSLINTQKSSPRSKKIF